MIPKPEQFMDEANRAALCCWMETKQSMIDAGLLESVSNRIAAWMATSAEMSNNAEFYHGIVTKTGEQFGKAARTSDDGSIQDSVLALKVPELVAGLFKALEIANRSADEQMWQKREAQAAAESARASEMALRQSLDLMAEDMTQLQDILSAARHNRGTFRTIATQLRSENTELQRQLGLAQMELYNMVEAKKRAERPFQDQGEPGPGI